SMNAKGRRNFGKSQRNTKRRPALGNIPPPSQGIRDIPKVQCFHCQKYDHFQDKCPLRNNNRNRMDKQHA
ncbi:hypothetical protein, partial [Actinobacillus pleuropneumoniae]